MNRCSIRKGFLTLRDCGSPAARNCSTCNRPACTQHLAMSTGFAQCLECAARPADEKQEAKVDELSPEYAYRFRRRYYDAGYAPIYLGSTYSDYDDYDVRSFDASVNEEPADDDGPGSFGDS